MGVSRALLAAVATAGCAERSLVFVELPVEPSMASVLVAVARDGGAPELRAFDLAAADPIVELELPVGGAATVELAYFRGTLAALEIDPAHLVPAPGEPERPIPAEDRLYRVALPGEARFSPVAERSAGLAALRLPLVLRCEAFTTEVTSVDNLEKGLFVQETPTGDALVGFDGDLYRFDGGELRPQRLANDQGRPLWVRAVHRDPASGLWFFAGDDNVVYEVEEVERDRWTGVPRFGRVPGSAIRRLHIAGTGSTATAWTIGEAGDFVRSRAGASVVLHDYDGPPRFVGRGLAALPSGEVVAAASNSSAVVVDDGARVRVEEAPTVEGFSALRYVPGLGLVLGTGLSAFFVREAAGVYRELPRWESRRIVTDILPTPQGFFFSVEGGAIVEYVDGEGHCPAAAQASLDLFALGRFRDGLVGIGANYRAGVERAPVTILRRAR